MRENEGISGPQGSPVPSEDGTNAAGTPEPAGGTSPSPPGQRRADVASSRAGDPAAPGLKVTPKAQSGFSVRLLRVRSLLLGDRSGVRGGRGACRGARAARSWQGPLSCGYGARWGGRGRARPLPEAAWKGPEGHHVFRDSQNVTFLGATCPMGGSPVPTFSTLETRGESRPPHHGGFRKALWPRAHRLDP